MIFGAELTEKKACEDRRNEEKNAFFLKIGQALKGYTDRSKITFFAKKRSIRVICVQIKTKTSKLKKMSFLDTQYNPLTPGGHYSDNFTVLHVLLNISRF